VKTARRGEDRPRAGSGPLLRPTAWAIGVFSLCSIVVMVLIASIAAMSAFSGGTLTFFRTWGSDVFMSILILAAACSGGGLITVGIQSAREARRGYTTIVNAYPRLDWRDHRTGLTFRVAGEPTPSGSIAELRIRASSQEPDAEA